MKTLIVALLFLLPSSVFAQNYIRYPQYNYRYPKNASQNPIYIRQEYENERRYNEAEYYFKLKQLNRANRPHNPAPTKEQLERISEVQLPPKLTRDQFSGGVIFWPEFFLMGNQQNVDRISAAMAGDMSFWDDVTVRHSVRPLHDRLEQNRSILTGNERIEYRRFLKALEGHSFYRKKTDSNQ